VQAEGAAVQESGETKATVQGPEGDNPALQQQVAAGAGGQAATSDAALEAACGPEVVKAEAASEVSVGG
jgi:hypothetical protein